MQISWLTGGPQGSGVDTAANIFSSTIIKLGYYVFGSREYYSNIKGRHSYFNISISDKPVNSLNSKVDILAAFDAETVFQHFDELKGYLIVDKSIFNDSLDSQRLMEDEIKERAESILDKQGLEHTVKGVVDYLKSINIAVYDVDFSSIISRIIKDLSIDAYLALRAKNIIAISLSLSLLGADKSFLLQAIKERFKNELFYRFNSAAVDYSYNLIESRFKLNKRESKRFYSLDGNTLSALGKIAGGLRFQSYYPITPASDESTFIEANQILNLDKDIKGGVVVVQTEDELSAINSAIGAALTGARAATATSGPGFSLMAEGISWAGMNEVPVVITYYMRGAPSTGLPTRSGQADLKFALNAGHGEFPRIVLASGLHYEVMSDAAYALNLAARYQTPVIHIIEKSLANTYSSIEEDLLKVRLKIDKIKRADSESIKDYKRFLCTEDGVSPFAPLGETRIFYSGDEHDEYGYISEAPLNREKIYKKRMKKLDTADKEIPYNDRVRVLGNKDARYAVLTWGSPTGPLSDIIADNLLDILVVQVKIFNPYPSSYIKEILSNKTLIAVENNYNALGAEILKENTGIDVKKRILKLTGRVIYKDELYDALNKIIKSDTDKVFINDGK
ncbi:MAG: 2-oxoacid:ferredoxin oxidoreductase subunit alpha [Candidatus Micrarchaeota archaeon]|nr:MAG: 2-oxoacid:ferredoxin oxidoreductase subunit alpha [Candidatus Micrarchaeota archaeon]